MYMTPEQAKKKAEVITGILKAVGDTLKESPNGIPSGELYAILMAYGCSLDTYNAIIDAFKTTGKVKEKNFKLYWIES